MNFLYTQDIKILNKNDLLLYDFKTDIQLLVNFNPTQSSKIIFSELTDNISIVSIFADGNEVKGTEFDDELAGTITKIAPNETRIVKLCYSPNSDAWILIAYDNTDLILKEFAIPVKSKCIEINYCITYISEITKSGDYIIENSKAYHQIFCDDME